VARSVVRPTPPTSIFEQPERKRVPDMHETSVLIEGGLNILLGKSGAGKSLLAAAMAAAVSRGHQPVTGEQRCPGVAFYLAGEERAETIVNRLAAAGADLGRVAVLSQSLSKSGLRRLPQLARAGDVSLAVFDPLPPGVASHSELTAFLAWANANGVTVLATAQEAETSRSVLTLARTAFLVSCDRFNCGRRLLLPLKHPALTRAMPFSIEQPDDEDGATPQVTWERLSAKAAE
jgi:hypothetical protein